MSIFKKNKGKNVEKNKKIKMLNIRHWLLLMICLMAKSI